MLHPTWQNQTFQINYQVSRRETYVSDSIGALIRTCWSWSGTLLTKLETHIGLTFWTRVTVCVLANWYSCSGLSEVRKVFLLFPGDLGEAEWITMHHWSLMVTEKCYLAFWKCFLRCTRINGRTLRKKRAVIPATMQTRPIKMWRKSKRLQNDYLKDNANNELDFQYVLTSKAPELLLKVEEYTVVSKGCTLNLTC